MIEQILNGVIIGLNIALAVYGAAVTISRLTPTDKDDKAVEKVRKVFEFIQNIVPDLARVRGKIKKK